ncbi:glycosyltransferase family 2 protein [Aquibium microcysteis]|uniref:glycosyltransferase family 2 protein n=1 Tax=Aquibium microcysteis TaxID=675281 RepID=UPI001EF28B09|nr:glycosyltransferase family 2 protein [Aquibium microcysteis]
MIPAWNAAATIAETLLSVAGQTYPATEIILVDDASTDGTVEAATAAGIPFRTIRQTVRTGPGAATTAGWRNARSECVAFLDADDLWAPGKMELQLAHLAGAPAAAGVFGHWRTFRSTPEEGLGPAVAGWTRTTLTIRRDVLHGVGAMVDLPGRVGDMIDWIQRAREQAHLLEMMSDVVAFRRIRTGSLSDVASNTERNRGYLTAARNAILRQKASKAGS